MPRHNPWDPRWKNERLPTLVTNGTHMSTVDAHDPKTWRLLGFELNVSYAPWPNGKERRPAPGDGRIFKSRKAAALWAWQQGYLKPYVHRVWNGEEYVPAP